MSFGSTIWGFSRKVGACPRSSRPRRDPTPGVLVLEPDACEHLGLWGDGFFGDDDDQPDE
jgi:hypothetical protein